MRAYLKAIPLGRRISRGRLGKYKGFRRLKARIERVLAGGADTILDVGHAKMIVACDGVGISGYAASKDGDFEGYMAELMASDLENAQTFIDVGASSGFYSLLGSSLVGFSGTVYAFEPAPQDFSLLLRNLELNGSKNVKAIMMAASNKAGSDEFFVADGKIGYHSFHADRDKEPGYRAIKVDCTTVDAVLDGASVDVVKIDAEGHEPFVLEGMVKTLGASPKVTMFIELNPALLARSGFAPGRLIEQITGLGFDVAAIDEDNRTLKNLGDPARSGTRTLETGPGINLYCTKPSTV